MILLQYSMNLLLWFRLVILWKSISILISRVFQFVAEYVAAMSSMKIISFPDVMMESILLIYIVNKIYTITVP